MTRYNDEHEEDPNGQWVKFEDVKDLIEESNTYELRIEDKYA